MAVVWLEVPLASPSSYDAVYGQYVLVIPADTCQSVAAVLLEASPPFLSISSADNGHFVLVYLLTLVTAELEFGWRLLLLLPLIVALFLHRLPLVTC